MKILHLLVLLYLAHSNVNAHVQMKFAPLNRPIRNAPSLNADGAFSTDGACGGVGAWTVTKATGIKAGSTICGKINYNGGHRDPANAWRAVFLCGQPTQTQVSASASRTLITGSGPGFTDGVNTIPSPTGNEIAGGYTLCVNVPAQGLNNDSVPLESTLRRCTFSIMDQRNWGGCVDLILSNDDGSFPAGATVATPSTTTLTPDPNLQVAVADEGTYKSLGCINSGGDCCATAYIGLKGKSRSASLKLVSDKQACGNLYTASRGGLSGGYNYQVLLAPSATDPFMLVARVNVILDLGQATQVMELQVKDAMKNGILLTNVGTESPKMQDSIANGFLTLDAGVAQKYIDYPNGGVSNDIINAIIACVVIAVVGVLGYIWIRRETKRTGSSPLSGCGDSFRSMLGMSVASKASSTVKTVAAPGPLPEGWKEAKDEAGDTYFYNKKLNKTQWDRPV